MSKLIKVPCRLHLSITGELYVSNTGLGSEAVAYPKAVAKALENVAEIARVDINKPRHLRGRLLNALVRLEKVTEG